MKITAILIILLLSLSASAGTFRDNFEDGNVAGWDAAGKWSVENEELVGENMEPAFDSGTISIGELGWGNYVVEADVKMIEVAGYPPATGIFVRAQQEPGHLHSFGLNPGSCGHTFEPETVPGFMQIRKFSVGTWYHLKVIAEDRHFELHIDDELIGELDHQSYPTGRVGLYVFNMEAYFDNVVIIGDDVPDAIPSGYALKSASKLATTWAAIKVH